MNGKKKFSKIQILISAFIIAAFSSMGALMYAGGSVHFSQFLSEGDICELSQADLRTSSRTMLYNAQYQRYDLTGKVCKKKYIPTGTEENWKYACVTITNMSDPSIEGSVVCYNKDKGRKPDKTG